MSIDISQVPEILEASTWEYVLRDYERTPMVYPLLGDVRPVPANKLYGDKGSTSVGLGQPIEFEDGEEISADTDETAYTWQLKQRQFGRKFFISRRLLQTMSAEGLGDYIAAQTAGWGEKFALFKDDLIAGMFQKGTLTAGSTTYFDGSFPGNLDPNRGFIYDGLPWFDGAHTLAASSGTKSNISTSLTLSRDNLQTAITTMESTNAVDERGERVNIMGNTLLVPPGLEFSARQIVGSALTSDQNQLNPIQGRLNVVPWRALTDDADAWWIGQSGKGLRIHDSGAPQIRVAEVPHRDGFEVYAVGSFGAAVTNWRYWYSANKADS